MGTYLFGSILFYFILFYVLANFGHLATINVCSATHKKKDQTFVGEKNAKVARFRGFFRKLPYLENRF